jgi:hypothetical protein
MLIVKKQKIIDAIKKSQPVVWGSNKQFLDYGLVILEDGKILVNNKNWMPNFETTINNDGIDTIEDAIENLLELISESDYYEIVD